MPIILIVFFVGFACPIMADVKLEPRANTRIIYQSKNWNRDNTRIDSGFAIIKDQKTEAMAKIVLDETSPASGEFGGSFQLDFQSGAPVEPQVFIPSKPSQFTDSGQEQWIQQVRQGKAPRKPVVFSNSPVRGQELLVFDTKAQAQAGLIESKKRIASERRQNPTANLPAGSLQNLENLRLRAQTDAEAERLARKMALMTELDRAAQAREAERSQLAQKEAARQRQLKKAQQLLAEAERQKRQQQASAIANQANQHYARGEYVIAENLFRQATELDPTNTTFYFQYGVSLFRNDKFNDALVIFRLIEKSDNDIEKQYYMGLIHLRLKEMPQALDMFRKVRSAATELAPSAAFYEGIVLFTEERLVEAKEPFEWVLDHSTDPKLDAQAERYLEQIAALQMFRKQQEIKWLISGTAGITYDSNILFSPDQPESQGLPADAGGGRYLLMGSAAYRPLFTERHEWSINLNTVYMYSFDSEFSRADPWLSTLSIPWVRKGKLGSKAVRWQLAPSYELLVMDPNSTGEQSIILTAITLTSNLNVIWSDRWFSNFIAYVREEDSLLPQSLGTNDADVLKYNLDLRQTLLLGKDRKKILMQSLAHTENPAKGDEKIWRRTDLGLNYVQPLNFWDLMGGGGIAYYLLDYPKTSVERTDQNYTFSANLSRPLTESWLSALLITYALNPSTNENNDYKRYTALLTLSYSGAF